jgi:spermidine synthase
MKSQEITYRFGTEKFSAEQLQDAMHLYCIAGWFDTPDEMIFLKKLLEGSFVVCSAWSSENKLVGMGRAISDGVSDAYIQDVVVDTDYRGHGIGGNIVKKLAEELKARGILWIGLVGAPGTKSFYRNLGFDAPADYTFWQVSK